jgi:hypothetical protein
VEMARSKLSTVQAQTFTSEGALTSLEEALGDRDKQIIQVIYLQRICFFKLHIYFEKASKFGNKISESYFTSLSNVKINLEFFQIVWPS